eukprot:1256705-Rhodomonas_salina.1
MSGLEREASGAAADGLPWPVGPASSTLLADEFCKHPKPKTMCRSASQRLVGTCASHRLEESAACAVLSASVSGRSCQNCDFIELDVSRCYLPSLPSPASPLFPAITHGHLMAVLLPYRTCPTLLHVSYTGETVENTSASERHFCPTYPFTKERQSCTALETLSS